MKKTRAALIILGSLIGLQLIGAKLISTQVEENVRKTVQAYSEQGKYPLEVANFESGWFSSSFTVRVPVPALFVKSLKELGLPTEEEDGALYLAYETKLYHGPVIVKDGLHFAGAIATSTQSIDVGKLLLNARNAADTVEKRDRLKVFFPLIEDLQKILSVQYAVRVSYLGDIHLRSHIEGGKITFSDKKIAALPAHLTLSISPISYDWSLTDNYKQTTVMLQSGTINFETENKLGTKAELHITPLTFAAHIKPLATGYWDGLYEGRFGGLQYGQTSDTSPPLRVDFGATSYASNVHVNPENPDTLNGDTQLAIDTMEVESRNGVFDLGKMTLDASAGNILIAVPALQTKIAMDNWKKLTTPDPTDQFDAYSWENLKGLAVQQLEANPSALLKDYSIGHPDRQINMDGFLKIKPGQNFGSITEASDIAKHLLGELTIKLDPEYVLRLMRDASPSNPRSALAEQQIQQVLDTYVNAGYIEKQDGRFIAVLHMEDDKITINGQPLGFTPSSIIAPRNKITAPKELPRRGK